jgi:dephospho-CoA kinase
VTVRVGLTGGIASGKSTVSAILAELGAVVIDADLIAREVVARGTSGLAAVVEEFGSDVLTPEGDLDRAAMGALVFADPDARRRLEAIVHPLVHRRSAELEADAPEDAVVVHDIPLLAEVGRAGSFDAVVVVDAPAERPGSRHRRPASSGSRSRRTSSTTPARSTTCVGRWRRSTRSSPDGPDVSGSRGPDG